MAKRWYRLPLPSDFRPLALWRIALAERERTRTLEQARADVASESRRREAEIAREEEERITRDPVVKPRSMDRGLSTDLYPSGACLDSFCY